MVAVAATSLRRSYVRAYLFSYCRKLLIASTCPARARLLVPGTSSKCKKLPPTSERTTTKQLWLTNPKQTDFQSIFLSVQGMSVAGTLGKKISLVFSFFFSLLLLSVHSLNSTPSSMKRVLVTGANKGIGKAICQLLLEKHPDVFVLLGSRNLGRGEEAVQDLIAAVGNSCENRLQVVQLDTSSTESVNTAAEQVGKDGTLYGIVNNAGIGFGNSIQDTVNTNYFGIRRVNDAFGPYLQKPGGRIVNVASASGPNFLSSCSDKVLLKKLAEPLSISGGVTELDEIATSTKTVDESQAYGFSKALVNAYTAIQANNEPDLIINSCTPGWINTDLTSGMGASNPPSKGAVPPVYVLMSEDMETKPTGRYYGSDCLRSPIDRYRNPGDPEYEGP